MENKINIAELLKGCPNGMELDCTMFENITFNEVLGYEYIIVNKGHGGDKIYLTKFGQWGTSNDAKCVIFPKGKTTWEGFQRPFKDGDIVFYDNCVSIFKEWGDETLFRNYVKVDIDGKHPMLCDRTHSNGKGIKREARFATEEEKAKLFKAIKEKGYKWNPKTKTLEKLIEPKFKVGDKVKHISAYTTGVVLKIGDKGYYMDCPKNGGIRYISFSSEKDYELVPNKFDITTLVPFESSVLVRDTKEEKWKPAIWGYYDDNNIKYYPYETVGGNCFCFCIPYEGNQHLLGTTDDCDDYFKTWEK